MINFRGKQSVLRSAGRVTCCQEGGESPSSPALPVPALSVAGPGFVPGDWTAASPARLAPGPGARRLASLPGQVASLIIFLSLARVCRAVGTTAAGAAGSRTEGRGGRGPSAPLAGEGRSLPRGPGRSARRPTASSLAAPWRVRTKSCLCPGWRFPVP